MYVQDTNQPHVNNGNVPAITSPTSDTHTTTTDGEIETIDATLQERIESILPAQITSLTSEQVAMAQSIIPMDSLTYICWLCRHGGHTLYTCPFLTNAQRLYAAYQNYLYQLETRPHMRNLLEQKAAEQAKRNNVNTNKSNHEWVKRPPTVLRSRRSQHANPRNEKRVTLPGATPQTPPTQTSTLPQNVIDAVMTIQEHSPHATHGLLERITNATEENAGTGADSKSYVTARATPQTPLTNTQDTHNDNAQNGRSEN